MTVLPSLGTLKKYALPVAAAGSVLTAVSLRSGAHLNGLVTHKDSALTPQLNGPLQQPISAAKPIIEYEIPFKVVNADELSARTKALLDNTVELLEVFEDELSAARDQPIEGAKEARNRKETEKNLVLFTTALALVFIVAAKKGAPDGLRRLGLATNVLFYVLSTGYSPEPSDQIAEIIEQINQDLLSADGGLNSLKLRLEKEFSSIENNLGRELSSTFKETALAAISPASEQDIKYSNPSALEEQLTKIANDEPLDFEYFRGLVDIVFEAASASDLTEEERNGLSQLIFESFKNSVASAA